MSCPSVGPCAPFVSELDLCCLTTGGAFPDPCLTSGQPVPQAIVDNALMAASEVLWAATGRQYGKCTVTIRPCQSSGNCNPCPDGGEIPFFGTGDFGYGGGFPWYPAMTEAGWVNVRPCGCNKSCGCTPLCEQELPYPTCCIEDVKVNGISLAPALYNVVDFKRLVRLPAEMVVQDLTVANPNVTVVGPGAAQNALGVEMPNDSPDQYVVQLGGNRRGVTFDLVWGPGVFGSVDLFGLAGGQWTFTVISGNPGGIQEVSKSGQTLTVGPPQDASSYAVVRIRLLDPGTITQFTVEKHLPFGSLWLRNVAWIDETTTADGKCWPECQNLALDDNQDNTYSITVTYGREPPELIKLATAALACEFIKACANQPCALPQRIQSISRQGITVGLLDPMDFLQQGRTGIYLVDLAINQFNPHKLLKQASVYSLDQGQRWSRVTGRDC